MTQKNAPQHVILGTGQLGLAIMDELVAQGLPVRMVNRRGRAPEPLPTSVELVAGDVTNPQAVTKLTPEPKLFSSAPDPITTNGRRNSPPSSTASCPRWRAQG